MNLLKNHTGLILIVLVGAALRLSISTMHGYSNDELSAINRLRYDSFSELIDKGVMEGDMHPAGVEVFMKGWSSLVGTSEFAMRFPFVICGLLSIVLTYILGLRWHSKNAGLFAAGAMAVLYFPVLQSEFARPYAPGLFFTLLSALFIERVLFCECNKWRNTFLLAVSMAGGMYTHYFCFLMIGWMALVGLVFLNRSNFKYYFIAGILAILLHLPHIGITMFHTFRGGLQWLGPPENDWLFQFLYHAFNESWWVIGTVAMPIFISFFFTSELVEKKSRFVFLCVAWFFGIYLVGHLLSLIFTPVLKIPVMLFAFPFLLLLIGFAVARFKFFKFALPVFLAVGVTSTIVQRDLFGDMHFENFREIAQHISDWKKKYGDENMVMYMNVNNPAYLNFYANQWGDTLEFDRDTLGWRADYELYDELPGRKEKYCIVGYSGRVTTVNVFETVQEWYPNIIEYHKYNNSAVFLTRRKESKGTLQEYEGIITDFLGYNGTAGEWHYDEDKFEEIIDGEFAYVLDTSNRFGPEFRIIADSLHDRKASYYKISVYASGTHNCQLTATVSAERNNKILKQNGENFWIGHDFDEAFSQSDSMITNSLQFSFQVPEFINGNDVLKIGLWNRNGQRVLIHSVSVHRCENIWN